MPDSTTDCGNQRPAFPNPTTFPEKPVSALLPNVDPQGLLEYSVVYTDRARFRERQHQVDLARQRGTDHIGAVLDRDEAD